MARPTPCSSPAPVRPQSFLHCLGYFLTPHVWKHAQQAVPCRRRAQRWQRQPLLAVLLVMTWCAGDSLPERFETARAFYVALHPRRRRPGKTFAGFEKALGQLPVPVLRAVARAVRRDSPWSLLSVSGSMASFRWAVMVRVWLVPAPRSWNDASVWAKRRTSESGARNAHRPAPRSP